MRRNAAPSQRLLKKGVKQEDIGIALKVGLSALDQLLQTGELPKSQEEEKQVLSMSEDNEENPGHNEVIEDEDTRLYYWCIFKRKGKDPENGILQVSKYDILLLSMDSKQVGSAEISRGDIEEVEITDTETNNKVITKTQTIKIKNKCVVIDNGKTFSMANKDVKVLISFPEQKFITGSIFLETPPSEKKCEEIRKQKAKGKKIVFTGRMYLSRKQHDFVVPIKGTNKTVRKLGEPLFNPNALNAVVLYRPNVLDKGKVAVVVDPILGEKLRPHQREGVKFIFECVMGLKEGFKGNGCILADGMGLGKTIQAVTLIWTLLRQGLNGLPAAKKVMVVAPSSLVGNWQNEFKKWLGDKAPRCVSVASSGKKTDQALSDMEYGYAEILIISYDQLRIHIEKIEKIQDWGLIVCDEGHRLKNADIKCSQAVNRVGTKRRVILSGTPIQNDLGEFYAMVSFVNPGVLSDIGTFKKVFEAPILRSREIDCTPEEKQIGQARSKELTRLTKLFILRRTSKVNQKYLPDKVQHIVFCKLTSLQRQIYKSLVDLMHQKGKGEFYKKSALQVLTGLKKVSNHPWLVQEMVNTFPDVLGNLLPDGDDLYNMKLSGKTSFLADLLSYLRKIHEKIVIVSNYTETLQFISHYCREKGYPYLQLDGSTAAMKRTAMVERFNNPELDEFVFLLSSKAGGCGLNLVGASNLVMFDPDWNPANDEQAMGRIWRDGQKKKCHIYRTLSVGTVEEKMYQRQVKKLELAGKIVEGGDDESSFDAKQLKALFDLKDTVCETHDLLGCTCGAVALNTIDWKKNDSKLEVLRKEWKHYLGSNNPDDDVFRVLKTDGVSFLFSKEDHQIKDDGAEEEKIVEEKMPGDSSDEEEEEEDVSKRLCENSDVEESVESD